MMLNNTRMRQIFYIDIDEEMISVVGRLRRSPARENIIVAPKRAIILQSVVNLRLLQHEVKKLAKTIMVVTQDEQGRALCQKIGIPNQPTLEEEEAPRRIPLPHQPASYPSNEPLALSSQHAALQEEQAASSLRLPHSQSVGSSDFLAAPSPVHQVHQVTSTSDQEYRETSSFVPPLSREESGRKIRVHDRNPKYLTALNSKLTEEQKQESEQRRRNEEVSRPSFVPHVPQQPAPLTPTGNRPMFFPSKDRQTLHQEKKDIQLPHSFYDQGFSLENHTSAPRGTASTATSLPKKPSQEHQPPVPIPGGNGLKVFFLFFGAVSLLSVACVGAYVFLPKAEITVQLKEVDHKADLEFHGSAETKNASLDSKTLPIRLIEKEQDITLSFPATGTTSLADQKARGSIVISNDYNSDPQTLVASTRLVSEDGKIFRLLNGITVPGKTDSPGMIEAAVIADQAGTEYNIGPSTFTIPGFEGSPKYAKFSGKSLKAMNGGGTSGSSTLSVSEQDIAKAKKETELKLDTSAYDILAENLLPGEKILDEAIEKTVVKAVASPQVGAVADTFEYRVTIHVRTLVFSEELLKKMASESIEKQNNKNGDTLVSQNIRLEYGEPSLDFSAQTMDIKVHAVDLLKSQIDTEALKADLVGRDENDINSVLQKYPQIEKVSINIWPDFLSSKVPSRENRVKISIESSEE